MQWQGTEKQRAQRDRWKQSTHHMLSLKGRQKVDARQKTEIMRRRYEGEDPKDLALEFGITASYVRRLAPLNG